MSARIFVDTPAYYALTDSQASEHPKALADFQQLTSGRAEIYTTNFVVAETHALILIRMDRDAAERVLVRLYASATHIIRATERDETRAREIIHHQRDKEYSYVDAISFAVMERLHIRHVWTYDHHFFQFGFSPIRHP